MEWIANDEAKESVLRRGMTFYQIVCAIQTGRILDDMEHPKSQYQHQRLLIVAIGEYPVAIPYYQDGNRNVMITAFKTRKFNTYYEERI